MSLLHPLFMTAFFYFVYKQKMLGMRIFSMKERSPDFAERPKLLEAHIFYAYLILAMGALGMFGGILATAYVLQAPAPFYHTYGHGFMGILVLATIVTMLILGKNIKHVVKPKIRERFIQFHTNMVYVVFGFGSFSALTGLVVLVKGLSLS